MARMLTTPPLSLYVHLPWCVRKCPYCDFNSHEFRGGALPFAAYVDALVADLEHDLPLAWGRTVHTVFFGGGTPSLFPPMPSTPSCSRPARGCASRRTRKSRWRPTRAPPSTGGSRITGAPA